MSNQGLCEICGVQSGETGRAGAIRGARAGSPWLPQRNLFTGFVQWDREECVGPDEFDGQSLKVHCVPETPFGDTSPGLLCLTHATARLL